MEVNNHMTVKILNCSSCGNLVETCTTEHPRKYVLCSKCALKRHLANQLQNEDRS